MEEAKAARTGNLVFHSACAAGDRSSCIATAAQGVLTHQVHLHLSHGSKAVFAPGKLHTLYTGITFTVLSTGIPSQSAVVKYGLSFQTILSFVLFQMVDKAKKKLWLIVSFWM